MIEVKNIVQQYKTKEKTVNALNNIDLKIDKGEFVIINGPSGSGKTTLLMNIGGMLKPSSGSVLFNNENLYTLNNKQLSQFRSGNIGFIFQMFHLIPYLNIKDNIQLPAGNKHSTNANENADLLIKNLGLSNRLHHKPSQLSTGEKQRVAFARAIYNKPSVILADEPTGNLDPDNADYVIEKLNEFHDAGGTVIIVSHGNIAKKYATRIIQLKEGKLV